MESKRKLFNMLKKNRDNKIEQSIKPNSITVNSILEKIVSFYATTNTDKSKISLVYNFGERVDIMISFAKIRNSIKISKGLSSLKNKKYLSLEEWNHLDMLSDSNNIRVSSTDGNIPIFIILNDVDTKLFHDLLNRINDWSESNYPLVIGIDSFNNLSETYFDIPATELLSTVIKARNLKFVFYYRGYCGINFLNIPELSDSPGVEHPVGYFEGKNKQEAYLNSMIELRTLLQNTDNENAKIYKNILLGITHKNISISGVELTSVMNSNVNIYDNLLKRFLFKTNAKYRMGYCLEQGGTYVEFQEDTLKFSTNERYVLVTRNTTLMLNSELIKTINKVSFRECKLPKIKWYDGVPGCGKSHFIVSHHEPGKDLVLTQTRAGIKEIRDAVIEMYGQEHSHRLNLDYRTVGSYIINHTQHKTYDRVFIDEALLMHAGYIGFISKLSKASEIIVVGDSKQIPYIERSTYVTRWHKISEFCEPHTKLTVSRRCPIDICFALSKIYENITTINERVFSILPTYRNGEYHVIKPDTLILTFTQEEKHMVGDTIEWREDLALHTIHEAQGLTSKNVILIRINYKENDIYNSMPHAIVALSRHTETFRYLTTSLVEDTVDKLIKNLKLIDGGELEKWNKERRRRLDSISYG